MFFWLKKYFIPHQENEYKPHILRKKAVIFLLVILVFLETFFLLQTLIVFKKTNLLAQILPAVVIDLTNDARKINNLSSLETNQILESAAKLKAEDMAKKGYFSHTSPDGKSPWYFFEKAGYYYSSAGENLAIHFFDSQDLINTWLASPSHRSNILNKNFTETGTGVVRGFYQGKETVFIVQLFGAPVKKPVAKLPAEVEPEIKPEEIRREIPPPEMYVEKEPETALPISEGIEEKEIAAIKIPQQSSLPERVISSPRLTTKNLYFLISLIIILALILNIFIHIRIQYFNLILNGLLILIFIILAFFLNKYLILTSAQIF